MPMSDENSRRERSYIDIITSLHLHAYSDVLQQAYSASVRLMKTRVMDISCTYPVRIIEVKYRIISQIYSFMTGPPAENSATKKDKLQSFKSIR